MALGLQTIREAVKTRLTNATNGVRGREVTVYAYRPAVGERSYPCLIVAPPEGTQYVDYFMTFGTTGQADIALDVEVHVDNYSEESQQIALDAFLSAGSAATFTASVFNAIEADVTLSGAVESCKAMRADSPRPSDEIAGVMVARIPLEIIARKDA